nr:TAT-variant-translocated molybdopterin oxidoreductase [Geminisphaera colitermitum]
MKRKFHHPEPDTNATTPSGRNYWRSLDELAATPGFKQQLEREFPEGASTLAGVDRRQFFKLMAAGFALGGLGLAAGCRRPEKHILPYGKSVEDIIPGLPLYYATAFPHRRGAIPLLAETHQGRPTKLEGNPTYKPYGGATTLLAQATVLDLYDPDRATTHIINRAAATPAAIQDMLTKIAKDHAEDKGAGLALLAGHSSSPTRARLVAALRKKFPAATWTEYEPIQDEPPPAAAQAAFGNPDIKPRYQFAKAARIVSIDSDFFHAESGSLYYTREFAKGRKVQKRDDPMNRLYAVESTLTLTGSMADHRLRLASSHMLAFIAALHVRITKTDTFAPLAAGLDFKNKDAWLDACAADLLAHRGRSIIVPGAHLPAQVHALAHAINATLGNIGPGNPVELLQLPSPPPRHDPNPRQSHRQRLCDDAHHPRRQSRLRRARRPRLPHPPQKNSPHRPPRLLRGRDHRGRQRRRARRHRAHRRRPLPRILGRCPHRRRHHRARATDDPAALQRPHRKRSPRPPRRPRKNRSLHPRSRHPRPARGQRSGRRDRCRRRLPQIPPRRPPRRQRLQAGRRHLQPRRTLPALHRPRHRHTPPPCPLRAKPRSPLRHRPQSR